MANFDISPQSNVINFLLNNYNSVYCRFRDEDGELIDVNTVSGNPYFQIIDNNKDATDPDRTVLSGIISRVDTGIYGVGLNPRALSVGYYDLLFIGERQDETPYTELAVNGSFQIKNATFVEDLIRRVRMRLKDINVKMYQLDLPINIWTDDEIYNALIEALDEINVAPPMRKNWDFADVESYGHGVPMLLVRAAQANLLESKAILETANTMSRSDGSANLNITRGQYYTTIANNIRNDVNRKIDGWKRSLVPNLWGQGSRMYPYQIRRAISFLPGMRNIFG